MHNIQRKILGRLLYAQWLSYAQMRPAGIESNHYAYHLDQLVRTGLVIKQDKKYSLSATGLSAVDGMSQEKMVDRQQPRIVTAVDITTDAGQSLLFRRGFQPCIGLLGFASGKTHLEETLMVAAERELQEKTGLSDIALTLRGHVYIEALMGGEHVTKALYHIFSGSIEDAVPTTASHRGECLWANYRDYPASQLMPGYLRIKKMLETSPSEVFFAELSEEIGG